MNLTRSSSRAPRTLKVQALALPLLVIAGAASAQSVFVPPPAFPAEEQPPAAQTTSTNLYEPSETIGPVLQAPPIVTRPPLQPFQWGPLELHPHLSYRFLYGSGILSRPGSPQNTIVQTVLPGLGLSVGSHWGVDYTPSLSFYSDKNFQDTVNHAISLTGAAAYEDWTFGLSQRCSLTSDPLVETGQQTDQQSYNTALNATYQLNTPSSLEMAVLQNIRSAHGFTGSVGSSRNWSTMNWFNYQWSPNLGTAAGVGVGYTAVDVGSDMSYEQLQGRITWHALQKVDVALNGGAEIRQFLDTSAPSLVSPLFGASLGYHPFTQTTVSMTVNQTIAASYYQNQVSENTSVNASLRQRLLGKIYLGLYGGYAHTTYHASAPGVTLNGNLDYTFFRVDLSTAFLKRGSLSVFYSNSQNSTRNNSSNQQGLGYSSNQMGFQLAYRY